MKVLIATDGSEYSNIALDEACWNILKASDRVRIVSVVEPYRMIVGAPFGVADEFYREMKEEAVRQARECVVKSVARIWEDFPEQDPETGILHGNAAQEIVEEAERWGADLIVTGSHGRGMLGRALLGSISNAVVNHAPCSVMIVRRPQGSLVRTR